MTVKKTLSEWMRKEFDRCFAGKSVDFAGVVVLPASRPEYGDYQCNSAMNFAKALGMSPRAIAETIAKTASESEAISRIEVAGNGFINITLNTDWLIRYVESMSEDAHLGIEQEGAGRTIIIDYSSPNVAKPMHIGHIRSTIIGYALDQLYRALGYKVIADNHIGDWGTQFGILIMGYRHFVDQSAMQVNPIDELERVYVKSYEKSQDDPAWLDACRQELVKLQRGDPENTKLWQQFISISLAEFDKIYRRLGVKFDLIRGESYYQNIVGDVISLLEKKGIAKESEGATVVFLDDEKLPPCIVRKRDGAFNYAATDIATVVERVREFNPERIIYVTDERQQLHFRQVFAICRKLGYNTELRHVWFGLMRLPEGTFSTRQGNVIKLEKLLDEAERRALEVVKTMNPEMAPEKHAEIARAVGIGAVKFADLSQNPQTTIIFSWEKALSLDGKSAPYLQYTCARIASVIDKYYQTIEGADFTKHPLIMSLPMERTLLTKIAEFPDVVVDSAYSYKPSILADYLYQLAQIYNTFYQNVPFLKSEAGIRESRVRLCSIVAKILRKGLSLLGIETPERI
jgi:arginyl-tRNA synthetase